MRCSDENETRRKFNRRKFLQKKISRSTVSDKRSEFGGLHGTLKLAIGALVMLTTNVDISDGLVNGARGEVVHIVTNNSSEVISILVKFDNSSVGLKAIQTSPYKARFANAVPLSKYEVVFFAKEKRGSEIKRLQFPLTLAWATTIHKVQGLTLDERWQIQSWSSLCCIQSCQNTSWLAYPELH